MKFGKNKEMKVEYIYNRTNDIVGRMEVHHLNLTGEQEHKVVLVNTHISRFEDIQLSCFNSNEISILNKYSVQKKKNEFISGRYSLNRISLPEEKQLFNNLDLTYDSFLTVLWTAKEAMSKAIKTGFTCNMDIFQVRDIKRFRNDYLIEYANFPAFQGIVKIKDRNIATLSYIKKLDLSGCIQEFHL